MIFPKLKQIEKFAIDNSPTILTVIGVIGTVGTALLTHKSTLKATEILQMEDAKRFSRDRKSPVITRKETFELTWKTYIPPVTSGVVTIGCIVMANRIGSKRAAAIAAAYTISERAYSEYREKVVEKIGESKERAIRDDIVADRLRNNPQDESNVVIVGSGNVLCYDMYTGRYFDSSVESIKSAVNEINYQINTHGYASLSDFYNHIGIPRTGISDMMGWTSDKLLNVDYTAHLSEDGRPCVAINFQVEPVRNFDRFH